MDVNEINDSFFTHEVVQQLFGMAAISGSWGCNFGVGKPTDYAKLLIGNFFN